MSAGSLKKIVGGSVLLALSSGAALAQDGGWTSTISMYVWFNETNVTADTPRGEVDADLSFSDALDNLDFAFMGVGEARNGPWGIIGDLFHFKLSADADTPTGVLFSSAEVRTEVTALSGYAIYRVYEEPGVSFDAGAGFRAYWLDLDTTLVGALAPTQTFSQDNNWVDPLLAVRLRMDFNERTFGTLFLDAGGTGESDSWQALATVGYRVNDNWALQGGYRHLESSWETDFGEASFEFSGPIIGATYRF
ncbi:hypothetical protein [Paracoccus sp. (in: a-proteobacteria)]|uniref:hypothetical protein n=1 Tax=Paracoccus sp. TaxID=267 RepID=UPI0035B15CDA